jgi:hypothetical protein
MLAKIVALVIAVAFVVSAFFTGVTLAAENKMQEALGPIAFWCFAPTPYCIECTRNRTCNP